MKYWLNLYTYKTWQEFQNAGGNVTGFRSNRWRTVQRIKKGDILLCYMTGISRFFAVQEVIGDPFKDDSPIWEEVNFPSRVPVQIILDLEPGHAIPVKEMGEKLSIFRNLSSPHAWTGFFRGSPNEFEKNDAEVILSYLEQAYQRPYFREFDSKKLDRKVPTFESKSGTVSIPDSDDIDENKINRTETHEEIQWLLLMFGQEMGLDIWVAKNDRTKSFDGNLFAGLKNLRENLPVQFDAATNRTIELIDVLWLEGNRIVAAFEIEHTTSVYSGLLRMADLITMQPNIEIPLYIVAPEERFEKVQREINRPVFSKALKKPLPSICQYISYTSLKNKLQQAEQGGFLKYLRPNFLVEISEDVSIED